MKAEFFNPAASVKDRLALNIIEAAERNGTLKPGQTVVEATSGNTGIGLAMVCAQKGYPLVVTMADSFSIERRKLMRILGAKVVLTPRAAEGLRHVPEGGRARESERLVPRPPVRDRRPTPRSTKRRRRARSSPTSRASGSTTSSPATAPAARVTGVARVLRRERPETKIVLCEPANAQLVGSGKVAGTRSADGAPGGQPPGLRAASDPGLDAGLHSAACCRRRSTRTYYDERDADRRARRASSGPRRWRRRKASSPASPAARPSRVAMQVAEKAPAGLGDPGMLPDTGERYLTTPLFEGIAGGHGRGGASNLEVDAGLSNAVAADGDARAEHRGYAAPRASRDELRIGVHPAHCAITTVARVPQRPMERVRIVA